MNDNDSENESDEDLNTINSVTNEIEHLLYAFESEDTSVLNDLDMVQKQTQRIDSLMKWGNVFADSCER